MKLTHHILPGIAGLLLLAETILAAPDTRPSGVTPDSDPLTVIRAAIEDELFDLAAELLERILDAATDSDAGNEPDTLSLLARIYHEQGRHAAIIERIPLEQAVTAELLFWCALARHYTDRHEETLELTARISELFPASERIPDVLLLRAAAFRNGGRPDEALEVHAALADRYPDAPQAPANRLAWAKTLMLKGQNDAAAQQLTVLASDLSTPAGREAAFLTGSLAHAAGRHEEAATLLGALLEHSNLSPVETGTYRLLLSEALEHKGEPEKALHTLESAIPLLVSAEDRRQARIAAANLMFKTGRAEEAATLLREIIHANPGQPDVPALQLGMANGLLREKFYERAAGEFQIYLEAFTNRAGQATAMSGMGWALLGLERMAEAAENFEQAAQLLDDPQQRIAALFKAADAWFAAERFGMARESYQRAARAAEIGNATGHVAQARYMMAETMIRREQFDEALETLRALASDLPDQPFAARARLRIAKLHEQRGALLEALADYESIQQVVTDPEILSDSLLSSGMLNYQLFLFEKAVAAFDRLLLEFPEHHFAEQARFMRIWSYSMGGREQEAMAAATDFLAHHPDSPRKPEVLFRVAEHDFNHERLTEAETGFTELANRYSQSSVADDALLWAGRTAARRKNFKTAIDLFSRLAQDYPDSPRLAEARFSQADAFSELGEFTEAVILFDEVIARFPNSYLRPSAMGRKGDCLFMLGNNDPQRYHEAIAAYQKLLEMPETPPDLQLQAIYKIGRCHEHLGAYDRALEYFHAAIVRFREISRQGIRPTPAAVWGFQRAAFDAAALLEAQQRWRQAVRILQRVVDAGVPAAAQAADRIERLRADHWLLFY